MYCIVFGIDSCPRLLEAVEAVESDDMPLELRTQVILERRFLERSC